MEAKRFVVSDSGKPGIRAGPANVILLLGVIAAIFMIWSSAENDHSPYFGVIIGMSGAILITLYYTRYLASITISNDNLALLRALDEVKIPKNDLKRMSIHVTPISYSITIFVYRKSRILPHFLYFSTVGSRHGTTFEAGEKLQKFFGVENAKIKRFWFESMIPAFIVFAVILSRLL